MCLTSFQNEGPEENRWLNEDDFTSDGKYDNPILEHYKQKHHLTTPEEDVPAAGSRSKRSRKS
jgi:hypothetical protein